MPSLNRLGGILVVIGISLLGSTAQAQSSGAGQTVSVNGMEMYYEIHGQGEPLVLLHGFFNSGAQWRQLPEILAAEYQVIVPDLRGHGRSTNPSNELTHKQAASDVFALLDHLSVDEFQAMGISSGGMTLLHMATSQPERVDAMILIGATSYFPAEDRAIKRAIDPETQPLSANMRRRHVHGDDQIRALWRQFRDSADNYDDMNFTPPYLSTITARTLIVHGDRDQYFPVNIPVDEYEAIPHSYLWIVPNGPHIPIFETGATTDYFTATALAFLRGEWEPQ